MLSSPITDVASRGAWYSQNKHSTAQAENYINESIITANHSSVYEIGIYRRSLRIINKGFIQVNCLPQLIR